ncbi:MAG: 2-alkenal reductase [Phycisphaerae bacterium]|nr:2-alkenal reductase [Phycisphaerae bacterium]
MTPGNGAKPPSDRTRTTMSITTDRISCAREQLALAGQEHVLHFVDALNDADCTRLLSQIESIDWSEIGSLIESHVNNRAGWQLPDCIDPAPWYPCVPAAELQDKYTKARALGEQLLRGGKVAAFTVAGGQGTRLGWDAPKGTFAATPITGTTLFGCLAGYITKAQARFGCTVPWYIMTSPANDADTRAFFEDHGYFGLGSDNIMLFPQAMMPAIDATTAKVLLTSRDGLALSPNGHGGALKALHTSGATADMRARGVEQISYTQVDNPLVKVVDPLFIGLHALDEAQMSSKMVSKAHPTEKLGNFCLVDDKMAVIEYSDLPDELAQQRTADGELRFSAGSIAIHVIRHDFVEQLNDATRGFALPYHRADKKVDYLDIATGDIIEPDEPNAVKLEMFVFDALPLCESSIVCETDRIEEFAPIKNADAADPADCVDSPLTSRRLQIERAARWLESAGVRVPRNGDGNVDPVIEIRPTTAIEPDDLRQIELPQHVERASETLL